MTKLGDSPATKNEGEEQDNPTLWEIATTHSISYADAVPIQEDLRLKKEAKIEAAKIKKDVSEMDKLKKRAQEAEGELSIMKGIETNRVKEAQARSEQLQHELDKVRKNNNELYNRIAELIEANEQEIKNLKWIKDHDYIFLIDENKKLREELTKLKEDTRLASARKAGM